MKFYTIIIFILASIFVIFNVISSKKTSQFSVENPNRISKDGADNGNHLSRQRSRDMHLSREGKVKTNAYFNNFKANNDALNQRLKDYEDALRLKSLHPDGMVGMMSAKMRFFSELLVSGTEDEKKEAAAIFELAASEIINENLNNNANKLTLVEKYPEYALQINVAKEINYYITSQYICKANLDSVEVLEKVNLVEKYDYSFFYQLWVRYESIDEPESERVRSDTLNYYTHGLFDDKDYSWWLKEFKDTNLGRAFLKNNSTVDKFKPVISYD